jgi:hypothetical protein
MSPSAQPKVVAESNRLSPNMDFHFGLHPDAYYIFHYKKAAHPFASSCEGVSPDNGEAPGHQPGPEAVPTSQPVPRGLEEQNVHRATSHHRPGRLFTPAMRIECALGVHQIHTHITIHIFGNI